MLSKWYDIEQKGQDIHIRSRSKQRTLIFLHGLGDTAAGWKPLFTNPTETFVDQHTDVILLTAPTVPVTLNFGMQMPSWFDILELSGTGKNYNYQDAVQNQIRISEIVQQEIAFFKGDRSKIFVGGFSQGAAMTLDFYLKQEPRLGGCFTLSGFLFPQNNFDPNIENNVIVTHCQDDQVLNYQRSMMSYEKVKEAKGQFQIHTMKGVGHSISAKGLTIMRKFFKKLI